MTSTSCSNRCADGRLVQSLEFRVRGRSTERAARDFARLPGMRSRAASCQNEAYPTSPPYPTSPQIAREQEPQFFGPVRDGAALECLSVSAGKERSVAPLGYQRHRPEETVLSQAVTPTSRPARSRGLSVLRTRLPRARTSLRRSHRCGARAHRRVTGALLAFVRARLSAGDRRVACWLAPRESPGVLEELGGDEIERLETLLAAAEHDRSFTRGDQDRSEPRRVRLRDGRGDEQPSEPLAPRSE